MKERIKNFWSILKNTLKGWNADDPFRQSAVIAYYAVFSMPALMVLIINIVGFIYQREAITGEISRQISGVMGKDTAELVESMIAKASETKAGVISTIIAVATILFGATGVFIQFQKSLNQIWDVKEKPDLGFVKQLKMRLFSFGLILSVGFLLLVSFVISTGLAAFGERLERIFPDAVAYLMYAAEFLVSLSVITVLFALMFKLLPDVKISWRNIRTGAVLTGLLFMGGKYALSLYFGKAEPGSDYGTAGSVILILLWTSYSSMIVFFGAEFTKQHAVAHGYTIVPGKDAVKIESEGLEKSIEEKEHQQAAIEEKHQELKDQTIAVIKEQELNEETKKLSGFMHENKMGMDEMNRLIQQDKKINSLKGLRDEIHRKETELLSHGVDIKDNFKIRNLISGLFTRRSFRRFSANKWDWNDHLRSIARERIRSRHEEKTLWDKVKGLFA